MDAILNRNCAAKYILLKKFKIEFNNVHHNRGKPPRYGWYQGNEIPKMNQN